MPFSLLMLIEAAVLASSLSIDAFTAGFAYGSKRIRIPMLSAHIINLICSFITGLSLFLGAALKPYLPSWLASAAAFTILFAIGAAKLLDSITKSLIRSHSGINKEIKISMFNFKFILNLYANPEDADVDASTDISPAEAAALALSLSLDGIAVGFGAALVNVNAAAVFFCSLITNITCVKLGQLVGGRIAEKALFNISWLSGIVLLGLAFSKLF